MTDDQIRSRLREALEPYVREDWIAAESADEFTDALTSVVRDLLSAETQQIREERDATASKLLVEAVREQNDLRAHRDELLIRLTNLTTHAAHAEDKAEAEAQALREAVQTVVRGFDEGVFVRSIDGDADPAWAIKLMPFIQALATLQRLTPASPRTGEKVQP